MGIHGGTEADGRGAWGVRRMRYSIHTEPGLCDWIIQLAPYHKMCPWGQLLATSAGKMEQFQSHLAENRKVAASTQNQAMNALVFFLQAGVGTSAGRPDRCRVGKQGVAGSGGADAR